MKCDIITPTFNRPKLLRRGIESILNQTSSDWEHWIYDDGSDYDIRTIVEEYRDPRIHFVQGPKLTDTKRFEKFSPSVARNKLLRKSKNELIAYLDDDDSLWPEAIETAISYFEKFPERCVIYGKLTISDKNTENLPREKRQWRMFRHGMLNVAQVIHRRECFREMQKIYEEHFPENIESGPEYYLHQRLLKKYKFYPVEFYLVDKWQHPYKLQTLYSKEKQRERRRE